MRAFSSGEASLENWGSSRRPKAWDCGKNHLETGALAKRWRGFPGVESTCRTHLSLQRMAQMRPFASISLQLRAQVRKG